MDRFTAMETLISVIETGSFSAGARRMKVGQPAVSKAIAQLESKLGVRLFVRSTRGLTPTEAGQRFYERANAAIEAAEEAEVRPRGRGTSLSGALRVCAAVTFSRIHIVPAQRAPAATRASSRRTRSRAAARPCGRDRSPPFQIGMSDIASTPLHHRFHS
jgi:DNA-binding transcriptional LysR family regulator